MSEIPPEYLEKLKREFTESKMYEGYDADEDPAYFIDWLVERLYILEQKP